MVMKSEKALLTKVCSGELSTRPVSGKLLCANRGEIAIRVFRTCYELGLNTVAIFSYEDRLSAHRYKADEAYQIGKPGEYSPVNAYLAIDRIIHIAKEYGVTFIHPGYGFLSENAQFSQAVLAAGMKFIGPSPFILEHMGDKTRARELAHSCDIPIVPGSSCLTSVDNIREFISIHGLPVIIKAAMGGGGRGMRVIRAESEIEDAFQRAVSESLSCFGNGTVFVERFIERARHVEVQILADDYGNVIHLHERDCSVQRRHQKVIEVAPAIALSTSIRHRLYQDAVRLAHHVAYRNAGTVEFLVDIITGHHYFIEVNPRIQVEHTITEEITGIDIVSTQILLSQGYSLVELGLFPQEKIHVNGYAIQCRVTAEDPAQNFHPDSGRIEVYRSSGGPGIRLDGGPGHQGAIVTAYYDSLLVKVTARGVNYALAIQRLQRALSEFRIRGVHTNLSFLLRVLEHEKFRDSDVWTTFIDDSPELFHMAISQNRAQKLLLYLGDLIVNGSSTPAPQGEPTKIITPEIPILNGMTMEECTRPCDPVRGGWRQLLLDRGANGFVQAVREHCQRTGAVLITDTTWRDAHQSLLMTRMRTYDMSRIAPVTSHALQNAFSLEMWGGATFDVAMRFLFECPWDRLRHLRKQCPNIPFQMLLRGASAVGYTNYPDHLIFDFVQKAKEWGVDIFRVFDALNYTENLRIGIQAVCEAGGVAEASVCYTGDLNNPDEKKYTLSYYLNLVDELVRYGTHIIGIKDMAGVLRPPAAKILVEAIRTRYPSILIHLHTHDTSGAGIATLLAAIYAGVDIVDVAIDALSGMTSQPNMGTLVASLEHTMRATEMDNVHLQQLNMYWEQVRLLYGRFECGLRHPCSDVYMHEMPGGQYTNLQFQASSLGLGHEWEKIKTAYQAANRLCGNIVKVTPSSKVVGDLAQFMVQNELSEEDVRQKAETLSFPSSVVEYFQGYIGQPQNRFPEPLRSQIIKNLPRMDERPGKSLPPVDLNNVKRKLENQFHREISHVHVLSATLYPTVFDEYMNAVEKYGDLSVLPTYHFFSPLKVGEELCVNIGIGKTLFIRLLAVGPIDLSHGRRDVYFELNGEARTLSVPDRKTPIEQILRKKADPNEPGDVAAPMSGVVIDVRIKQGTHLHVGDPVCLLNAMKMESVVCAPIAGCVDGIFIKMGDSLSAGDLIACIRRESNRIV